MSGLAADHPDVVRRLVLLSIACRLGRRGRDLQARVARDLRAGRTRRAVSTAAGGSAPRGLRLLARGAAWTTAQRVISDPMTASDLAATIEAEDGFDLAACAQRIRTSTLIVAGGRDRFYGPELFRETAAPIPGSQLRLFPRRGHLGVLSDRVARATITGFIGQSNTRLLTASSEHSRMPKRNGCSAEGSAWCRKASRSTVAMSSTRSSASPVRQASC